MNLISHLAEFKSKDIIDELEKLLAEARTGNIKQLFFVVNKNKAIIDGEEYENTFYMEAVASSGEANAVSMLGMIELAKEDFIGRMNE